MKSIKASSRFKKIKNTLEWVADLSEDHPFEIGLSFALVLFGAKALLTGLGTAPGSVQTLPFFLAITYCSLSVLGGTTVIFGLLARIRFGWAYGVERFGLFVSASAWLSYIVGLVMVPLNGKSTLVILALAALAIGCLLRARAINRKARASLVALRYAQIEKGGRDSDDQ